MHVNDTQYKATHYSVVDHKKKRPTNRLEPLFKL